jgi:predicted SnoaL-like aldol condensation-catalyzing enzyme
VIVVTDQQQLEQNKKNVMAFYDLMFNQNNPAEAIKRYVCRRGLHSAQPLSS